MPTRPRRTRRSYGYVRRLRSGRFQASYLGPDDRRHNAPHTFDTKGDADAWLVTQRADILRGEWERPAPPPEPVPAPLPTFSGYSESWLATRRLQPGTVNLYRKLLAGHLLPTFGELELDDITPAMVRGWYGELGEATGATRRAHAYGLLKAILTTAVEDEVIAANPCRIRGASKTSRAKPIRPATLGELAVIAEAMPAEYRAAVLVAAWCGLRFGEVAGLRRRDVDLKGGRLRIRRAATTVAGRPVVGKPKSEAGVRDVAFPPHLEPVLAAHLRVHAQVGGEGLLFPAPHGGHLRDDGALHQAFDAARSRAGRPDLRFHDLRHTGATLAAAAGATIAELMARIGHTTPAMAMRYQHATADRDRAIAEALSEFHEADVVSLRKAAR